MADALPPEIGSGAPPSGTSPAAPPPALPSPIRSIASRIAPAILTLFRLSWPGRIAIFAINLLSLKAVWDWLWDWGSSIAGHVNAIVFWRQPDAWVEGWKAWLNIDKSADNQLAKVVHTVLSRFMGFGVSEGAVKGALDGSVSGDDLNNFADTFVKAITGTFDIGQVARGFQSREPGTAEEDNFRRFMALNARLHMGKIAADMTKGTLAFGVGEGIVSIAEAIEGLMGLEDAQEEILEPLMEKLIIEGWTKKFNREILGTDLTTDDAIEFEIRGWLLAGQFDKILDNEGIRPDVRADLIQLRAKRPSQSDLQDLYNRGLANDIDLTGYFRTVGFLAEGAKIKADLVASDRLWKLRKEQEGVLEQQAVKGIIPDAEYEGFLRNNAYKGDEVGVLMDILRRKKTLTAATTARRITGSFNITPERVKEGASAIIKWSIRNADTINITDLGAVGPRGEQPLEVLRSRTYTLTASNDAGEEVTFPAYVEVRGAPEIKLPRVSLSLSPRSGTVGSLRELRWNVSNAESITIDGVPVEQQGVLFVTPVLPTFYTLVATNAAGTATTQDVALIELPFDGIDPSVKPTVSFAISPLIVSALQPRVEIKWGTINSNSQTLTYPDGRTIDVGANGAMIEVITASGVFTFRAKNARGEVARQEAVIFKEALPDEA